MQHQRRRRRRRPALEPWRQDSGTHLVQAFLLASPPPSSPPALPPNVPHTHTPTHCIHPSPPAARPVCAVTQRRWELLTHTEGSEQVANQSLIIE